MKVVHGLRNIPRVPRPVVALGVFDGVHAGHRAVIGFCVRRARAVGGTAVVLTFWPHPGREEHLYSLSHRIRLLEEMGVDVCVVIGFTPSFARREAADFIRKVLVARIGVHLVCVGDNFRFGRRAAGTVRELKEAAGLYGFGVRVFPIMRIGATPVSSTLIRQCIKRGELRRAGRLLGRPVSVFGTVERGRGYGKKLGFPTANVYPHQEIIPHPGVYAVRVMLGEETARGVCYIGPPPAFLRRTRPTRARHDVGIEVHLFDFSRMIYGRAIEVQFLVKIRAAMDFPSPASLVTRIQKDIHRARSLLAHPGPGAYPTGFF